MANIRVYLNNALVTQGATLKNGTGGAPALDQDPDWPMRFSLLPDRDLFWRTSSAPGSPIDIDFEFAVAKTIRAGGIGRLRVYGGRAATAGCQVFYGSSGSSYPPTWTQAGVGFSAGLNNSIQEFTAQTSRWWRIEISMIDAAFNPLAFSCKPILVQSSDYYDLGFNVGYGSGYVLETLRSDVRSISETPFPVWPLQARSATARRVRLAWPGDLTAGPLFRDNIQAIDRSWYLIDQDGNALEGSFVDGSFVLRRKFSPPESFEFAADFQERV